MPNVNSVHRIRWSNAPDVNPEFVWFTCEDTYTQETYRFRVPLFALPSLEDHLRRALDRNSEMFGHMVHTRLG